MQFEGEAMPRYERLTNFIPALKGEMGEWVADTQSKGTADDPIHLPFVAYGEVALALEREIYAFAETDEGSKSRSYNRVLESNGLGSGASLDEADLAALDGVCVVAMMLCVIRMDRFCEGNYLHYLQSGFFSRCLNRLAELDGAERAS